jgi:hypothetical protein
LSLVPNLHIWRGSVSELHKGYAGVLLNMNEGFEPNLSDSDLGLDLAAVPSRVLLPCTMSCSTFNAITPFCYSIQASSSPVVMDL